MIKISNRYLLVITLFIILLSCRSDLLLAQDDPFNEQDLFSEESLFTDDEMIVEDDSLLNSELEKELNKQSLGITGEVRTNTTYINYETGYDWIGMADEDKNLWTNVITGKIYFDLRLKNGIKSFLSLEGSYYPGGIEEIGTVENENNNSDKKYTDLGIKEFFLDATGRTGYISGLENNF